MALFTNEDKWEHMDIAKMPSVRLVIDVDTWGLLYAATDEIKETYGRMEALFAAKWPKGYNADDVVFLRKLMSTAIFMVFGRQKHKYLSI